MAKPLIMRAQFIPSIHILDLGQQLIRALLNDDRCYVENILSSSQVELDRISAVDFGQAFIICIQRKLDFYYEEIFKLRNARDIPANGQWGLGSALVETARIQNPYSLQWIQGHPNFNHIDANGAWGLGSALEVYLQVIQGGLLNPAYLNTIIGHPNANQIQFQNVISDALGELLLFLALQSEKRFNHHDQGVVQALMHENISHLIQSNGQFGLGRVLLNAAYATNIFIVHAVLNHPGVLLINSNVTDVNETTQIEEDFDIQCFGFSEIIFTAVNNGDPDIEQPDQVQEQIVQSLLNFAKHHAISLSVNDPFGLADSLTSAATVNELLVPIILNFPSSNTIVANALIDGQGGLSDALYNAALEGHERAIQCILNHPNAYQISLQNIQNAQCAVKGNVNAVNLIRSFIEDSF